MLAPRLVERVLTKLGLPRPATDLPGLSALYGAWCRSVPFDNVRKLIHVRAGRAGPLPGEDPEDFFEAWLAHGTGGTCWAGNGALHALLEALGFEASRCIATMLLSPDLPPNHGSVCVTVEEGRHLVDASILHGQPLRLDEGAETAVAHPAWGVRCAHREGRFHVWWRPLHLPQGLPCRIEHMDAPSEAFRSRHEATRAWSPFNFQLSLRLNRRDGVVGVGLGRRGEIGPDGEMRHADLPHGARAALLESLGMSREIAAALPEDVPTPPPPGSATAARAAREASRG